MNRNWFLVLMLTFGTLNALSQITIYGIITDKRGMPIKGVNITLKDTYDGATSDSTGHYKFITEEKSKNELTFEATDYINTERTFDNTLSDVQVDVVMKSQFNELKAVTISAGVLDQRKISVLNPIDVVTVAGSSGDIAGALKTLPGTQQINDQQGLFVRGGTGYETQQFIDGSMVRNAFLTGLPNLGSRGRFSPFLFKGTVFSPGGYSAMYGQALSGAIILQSIDMPEKSSANLAISSVGIGAGLQMLSKNKKFTFGVNYNYTNLGLYFAIVPQLVQYNKKPEYHTLETNFRFKVKNGYIKFYNYNSLGYVGVYQGFVDSLIYGTTQFGAYMNTYLKNFNSYSNLSYKGIWNHNWTLDAIVSYSTNKDDFKYQLVNSDYNSIGNSFRSDGLNDLTQIRTVAGKDFSKKFKIKFGGEYQYAKDKVGLSPNQHIFIDNYIGLFAEAEIYANNNLGIKLGARMDESSLLKKTKLSPRLSVGYSLGKYGDLSAAYGIYYQKPESKYYYFLSTPTYLKAAHYILTYMKSMEDRMLRIEGFYKKYDDLVSYYNPNYLNYYNFYSFVGSSNKGTGNAQGVEFYFRDKKTIEGLDYWISYSFLDTKRQFENYPISTQPTFAAKHTASLVMKKFWVKRSFGINLSYNLASGRPYFDPNTYYDAQGNAQPSLFLSERTPTYGSLNLSANYLRKFGNAFTVFVLSLSNVLNQTQVYGYQYQNYKDPAGIYNRYPIYPGARQFIFLGVFMSFGVDRSQDAIDSNL